MNKQERAGRWLRVSTVEQDERSQEVDIDQWIEQHGYAVGPTYRVHGKSAYHGKQQADLDRAVADMESGEINVLVLWDVDRGDRRGSDEVARLRIRAKDLGCRIEYANPEAAMLNDPTLVGKLLTLLRAEGAHDESKLKADRIRIKHNALRARGSFVGRAPFGRRIVPAINGEGERIKTLAIDEVQADVLREARDRYLAGEKIADIVADFNRRDVPRSGRYNKGERKGSRATGQSGRSPRSCNHSRPLVVRSTRTAAPSTPWSRSSPWASTSRSRLDLPPTLTARGRPTARRRS